MSESPRDCSAAQPWRERGRRRVRAPVLSPAAADLIDSRVIETTKRSRSDTTLLSYSSYMKNIHDWYFKNEEDLCFSTGKVNAKLIRKLCQTREGLSEQSTIFKRCLLSKEHDTDKNADDTATCARVGTLSGYRSACGYFPYPSNDIRYFVQMHEIKLIIDILIVYDFNLTNITKQWLYLPN